MYKIKQIGRFFRVYYEGGKISKPFHKKNLAKAHAKELASEFSKKRKEFLSNGSLAEETHELPPQKLDEPEVIDESPDLEVVLEPVKVPVSHIGRPAGSKNKPKLKKKSGVKINESKSKKKHKKS